MTSRRWVGVALATWLCSCSSACSSKDDPAGKPAQVGSPAAGASPASNMNAGAAASPAPGASGAAGTAVAAAGTTAMMPMAGAPSGNAGMAGMPSTMAGASAQAGMGGASGAPPGAPAGALTGSCPDGFTLKEGVNEFPSAGGMRRFHASKAMMGEGPRPVFVALTGTVQEELSFAMQSGLSRLPASGWIVLSPVRSCAQAGRNCSTTGMDGRVWEPWYDATAPRGDKAGPDVEFVEAMVRCVASAWPVAADKIYAGGISAGGSFTNRNLTFNSKLFAGGVPASGNWSYGVPPASPMPMERSIAIVIWGGPMDEWPPSPAYAGETKAAAEYYAAQPNVVTVACSGMHGHSWPAAMTPWIAKTLLSHPKGSDPKAFVLEPPPAGLTCVVGPYTDH